MNNLPNNIAELRKRAGLNQHDLAEMIGVSQPHISRIERGDAGIRIFQFAEIAKALNVEIAALFSDDRSRSEQELVDAFRALPEDRRQGWLDMARLVHTSRTAASREGEQNPRR